MFPTTSIVPVPVNNPRMPLIQGQVSGQEPGGRPSLTIGMIRPLFLDWVRYEVRRSPWTVKRYDEALGWVIRYIGDVAVAGLHAGHLMGLGGRWGDGGSGRRGWRGYVNRP